MAVLRFRLGSIPVIVHPVHFLGGLFLGFLWSERAADPEARMTMIVLWVVVVFVSALVHELGHALAYRAFGYQPVIQLVALGGVTTTSTDVPLPFGRDVVTTLAGPTAGALLGLACLWLSRVVTAPSVVEGLEIGAGANIVWAVFNLFPILPLDGGRVSQTVLGRLGHHLRLSAEDLQRVRPLHLGVMPEVANRPGVRAHQSLRAHQLRRAERCAHPEREHAKGLLAHPGHRGEDPGIPQGVGAEAQHRIGPAHNTSPFFRAGSPL